MRSRLEARFAGFLDREGVDWRYEPVVFADMNGQYLPDFALYGLLSIPVHVEVKGPALAPGDMESLFERMRPIWASEDAVLGVVTAELFWREAKFEVRMKDGRTGMAQFRRCPACGISLHPVCRFCSRATTPVEGLGDSAAA